MNLRYILASAIFIFSINNIQGAVVGVGETCDGTTTTCDTGYFCAPWTVTGGTTGNACVKECTVATEDDDCGTGNTCEAPAVGQTTLFCKTVLAALAASPCTETSCSTGNVCDEYTLTCVVAPTTTTESTTTTSALDDYNTTTSGEISSTTSGSYVGVTVTQTPCVDLVTGGPNGCQALAAYCTNEVYMELMRVKCPKTCGYCISSSSGSNSGSGCRDGLSDCSGKDYLCKSTIYKDFMKANCPATCGYC
uniref:ShKT domain-containing protein n=1 Tax=Parastrongyloides trichosuri TaxID=131310 RepID=A0A0N4ZDT6_PARTI